MADGPFHSMQRFAELVGQAKVAGAPATVPRSSAGAVRMRCGDLGLKTLPGFSGRGLHIESESIAMKPNQRPCRVLPDSGYVACASPSFAS